MAGSMGYTDDDIHLAGYQSFIGREVVISEKMDGESFSFYSDGYFHARSIDSRYHPSRSYAINALSQINGMIPEGLRICGENLYAQHSIKYTDLPDYLQIFGIWEDEDCWDWQSVEMFCADFVLSTVPVLYCGEFSEKKLGEIIKSLDFSKQEGIVMRVADSFDLKDFDTSVCKFVRPNHVTTDQHWMHKKIEKNGLR